MSLKRFGTACVLAALFEAQTCAFGEAVPQVSWIRKPATQLIVEILDALSEQQKKLIVSGLTTFSHFEIQSREANGRGTLLFVAECTLKYDLWEEKFELQQLSQGHLAPQSLADYGKLCLRAELGSPASLGRIQEARNLEIKLDIAQVSAAFANDVRRWLIEQQSGVMRGLFSHMLGELQLSESVHFSLKVPPLDSIAPLSDKETRP